MGIRTWIVGTFDRKLTDKQTKKLSDWIEEFDTCTEARAEEDHFVVGWGNYDTLEEIREHLLKHLPKGTSVELEVDYEECDEPGKDWEWLGPRAEELEILWIDRKVGELARQRNAAQQRIKDRITT